MRVPLLVPCVAICAASALAADAPRVEVSVNYAFLHEQGTGSDKGIDLPAGWSASIAGRLSDSVSLVGDVGGNYKTETESISAVPVEVKLSIHSLHGGFRFSGGGSQSVTPYLQALAGVTRAKATGSALGVSVSDSTTKFSIQPGVGLDFRLSDNLAFGIGGDFRLIFTDQEKTKEFRARAGLVFRLGGS